MAGSYLPLAALLLATAVTLLVAATSAVPVAAAADKYSGRMVIIRAPGARVLDVVSAGGALNKWQQRRLVEDDVAPPAEFGGLLGAGYGGTGYDALDRNRQVCLHGRCAGQGGPYTRPCAPVYGCPSTPTAVHV